MAPWQFVTPVIHVCYTHMTHKSRYLLNGTHVNDEPHGIAYIRSTLHRHHYSQHLDHLMHFLHCRPHRATLAVQITQVVGIYADKLALS